MPRFRDTSVWSLRLGDVIRFRSPYGEFQGRVVQLDATAADGCVIGAVRDLRGRIRPFRLTPSDQVWRRPLRLDEMLSDLGQRPASERPIAGYQVKVGTERDPLWLHRTPNGYEMRRDMSAIPPFVDRAQAQLGCRWVTQVAPGVATLIQPVYEPPGLGPN